MDIIYKGRGEINMNKIKVALLTGYSLLTLGTVTLASYAVYRADLLNARLDTISQEVSSLGDAWAQVVTEQEISEDTTEEVAEITEATTEPEEVSIELREEFRGPSETQEEASEEEAAQEDPETTEATEEASEELEYVGIYKLSAYPWTDNPCADGVFPQLGYTAACNDPALWHKWVYIEGVGERYIHDTGNPAVMGTNTIDIYMADYDTCIQFGKRQGGVYVIDR
jgi:vacuolar-type H+-ATPase subunit I/STV1